MNMTIEKHKKTKKEQKWPETRSDTKKCKELMWDLTMHVNALQCNGENAMQW